MTIHFLYQWRPTRLSDPGLESGWGRFCPTMDLSSFTSTDSSGHKETYMYMDSTHAGWWATYARAWQTLTTYTQHTHKHSSTYAHAHTYMHVHTHTHTHMHPQTFKHMPTHIHTCTCTHIRTAVPVCWSILHVPGTCVCVTGIQTTSPLLITCTPPTYHREGMSTCTCTTCETVYTCSCHILGRCISYAQVVSEISRVCVSSCWYCRVHWVNLTHCNMYMYSGNVSYTY